MDTSLTYLVIDKYLTFCNHGYINRHFYNHRYILNTQIAVTMDTQFSRGKYLTNILVNIKM